MKIIKICLITLMCYQAGNNFISCYDENGNQFYKLMEAKND